MEFTVGLVVPLSKDTILLERWPEKTCASFWVPCPPLTQKSCERLEGPRGLCRFSAVSGGW